MQTIYAKAIYDNIAESPDELAFKRGDLLTVIEQDTDGLDGWWLCSLRGRQVGYEQTPVSPQNLSFSFWFNLFMKLDDKSWLTLDEAQCLCAESDIDSQRQRTVKLIIPYMRCLSFSFYAGNMSGQ